MSDSALKKLRYPIGYFQKPDNIDKAQIDEWINTIEKFPQLIQAETVGLDNEQLQWKYRPDGWNIRQLVHHCADSHMNAFIRFKLAVTEENPTIRPYDEKAWSLLPDGNEASIAFSEMLLTGLHARWTLLLKQLSESDLSRTFFHPEHQKSFQLNINLAIYAWHCEHHLAHVKQAKHSKGKY